MMCMAFYSFELTEAEVLDKYGPSNNGDNEDYEGDGPRNLDSWKENDM